jgi:cytochrome P450
MPLQSQNKMGHDLPSHVPLPMRIKGDPWQGLGGRPHDAIAQLHDQGPLLYAPNHPLPGFAPQGAWLVVGAREMRAVLIDNKNFASRGTTGIGPLIGEDLTLAPLESDPPNHARLRGILHPLFQPNAITKYQGQVRALAASLIDDVLEQGKCDFVRDFAQKLPTQIFLSLMGLPQERLADFMVWEDAMMGRQSPERMVAAWQELRQYLAEVVEERRQNPSDDVLSSIVSAQLDGVQIDTHEALGMSMLLFVAGLDTVVSSLSWQFRHLAENPDQQERLRRNPELIPAAVEEFLRAYAISTTTRIATADVELGGTLIKKGDVVTCPTMLGSRDPAEYQSPNTIDLERGAKRHLAFGFGPHICLGMHLARMEMVASIELWLSKVPSFRLPTGYEPACHGGISLGIDELQIIWK